jgi:purine-binding chemotaxis protein CheW
MATQLCTFYVGPLFLGIEVSQVQEVLRKQEMTRVPLAPPAVAGLINLRGQIVYAIELRHCLELAERPPEQKI